MHPKKFQLKLRDCLLGCLFGYFGYSLFIICKYLVNPVQIKTLPVFQHTNRHQEEQPAINALWQQSNLLNIANFTWLLNNASVCHQTQESRKLVPILVHSARSHQHERRVLRNSWGSLKTFKEWDIRMVFLIGLPSIQHGNKTGQEQQLIIQEHEKYGDMIMGNFVDQYYNLTYKHLMGYKWIFTFCPQAAFVLKVDDDMYVDIFRWLTWRSQDLALKESNDSAKIPDFYCQHIRNGSIPKRDISNKWDVTREEWPRDYYPEYCHGGAYGTTVPTMQKLYSVSNQVNFFKIDDVFVTGALLEAAKKVYKTWSPIIVDTYKNASAKDKEFLQIYCKGKMLIFQGSHWLLGQTPLLRDETYENFMMCLWKRAKMDNL